MSLGVVRNGRRVVVRSQMRLDTLVRRGGRWYVYSKDGTEKLAGPYLTRAAALKRLRQIEYFKTRGDGVDERAATTAHHVRILRGIGAARAPRRLPRQIPPKTIEREYASALLAYVALARKAFEPLLAELPRLLESASHDRRLDSARVDAGEGSRVRQLVEQARKSISDGINTDDIERLARKFAERTSTYQRIQLGGQVRAALGADVFLQDRRLKPLTAAFVDANVGLIKNIPEKLANDIESTTLRAIQDGMLHGDLAEELQAKFQIGEDRAKLIARDQIGKAYGQINAARQQELGVSQFVWRTVGDERVRDEHEALDGETFDYSDPPDGELPGEPINCRCYAEPVFSQILDMSEDPNPEAE